MLTSSWSRALMALFVTAGFASPAWAEASEAERAPAPFERRIVREGIAVDISLESLNPSRAPGFFMEGDDVQVRLAVSDTHTGEPITTLYPAGWMDLLPAVPESDPPQCKTKVEAFVGGSILAVP